MERDCTGCYLSSGKKCRIGEGISFFTCHEMRIAYQIGWEAGANYMVKKLRKNSEDAEKGMCECYMEMEVEHGTDR